MTLAAAFLLLAVLCTVGASALAGARWPLRAPRSAIALWQALGLAWGLALIGAALAAGLAPYGRGVTLGLASLASDLASEGVGGHLETQLGYSHVAALAVGALLITSLVSALVASFFDVVAARRRHRALLALVGHGDPEAPGALVLDHPAAAAYCLPGVRARVVVSEGALRLLDPAELRAVLAHERAHARERHDLVLLPFSALCRVLPRFRVVREALDTVGLLVEMCADDRARREHADRLLACALLRFGTSDTAGVPSGALAIADAVDTAVVTRVRRLLEPPPALPGRLRAAALAAAVVLVALAAVLLCVPVS
ncbi:MAG: M56 family metallopeptidase [Streptosporangiaceae bacterium]